MFVNDDEGDPFKEEQLMNQTFHHSSPGFLKGLKNFGVGLIDFRFNQYLSMQLLPVFYALLLMGLLAFFVGVNALAFWYSHIAGLVVLSITPFAMLISFAVVRATLEFLVMAYRIMETLHRMDRIPEQVDNLNSKVDGISDKVHGFETQISHIQGKVDDVTHTIGFLKPVSGLAGISGRLFGKSRD